MFEGKDKRLKLFATCRTLTFEMPPFELLKELGINPTKVIFNPPATILYKDGEKYVSKCDSADTFDEEKGLMMCLLKSHGYTYTDIKRLLESAKRFGE